VVGVHAKYDEDNNLLWVHSDIVPVTPWAANKNNSRAPSRDRFACLGLSRDGFKDIHCNKLHGSLCIDQFPYDHWMVPEVIDGNPTAASGESGESVTSRPK